MVKEGRRKEGASLRCIYVCSSANMSAFGYVCIYTCSLQPSTSHSWDPRPRERNNIRAHFLFVRGLFGASSFVSLTRDVWNVRQNQIAPRNLLQASASQPRTALFRQALMTANFCSADFLSWAKGLDKVHWGAVAPHPRFCPLLSFLFSFLFPPFESPPVIFPTHWPIIVLHAWTRSDLIGCSGVSGRSELCSFHTVSFWSPSSSTLREFTQAAVENKVRRRGWKSGKTETNRWKRVNSSVCSLQYDMISYLGNCKCVMFSAGLKFTLTPEGTSSAAAQHSLYCKAVCCLHNKRRSSQPECLCCVCVQWEGTVSPLGKALLRQENTWFWQPTISYGAVKGHEYLREMFCFCFLFFITWKWRWKHICHSFPCYVLSLEQKCHALRKELNSPVCH